MTKNFKLFVGDYNHSMFLWNALDQIDSFMIKDWVDYRQRQAT